MSDSGVEVCESAGRAFAGIGCIQQWAQLRVDGIAGPVDLNVFVDDADAFADWRVVAE